MLEAEIQLRPRVVYTRARVQNAVSRILELYRRNGRYAAKVEPKIIELDQNRVDLVFEINEGPVTGVGGITFIGNEQFSDSTLRGVIQTTESAWYRFLTHRRHLRPRPALLRPGAAAPVLLCARLRRLPGGLGRGRADPRRPASSSSPSRSRRGRNTGSARSRSRPTLRDLGTEQLEAFVRDASQGDIYNADQVEATIQALTDEVGRLGYAFVEIEPRADARTRRT